MCGIACGYGCCNSPTFKVTSEEHERTFLQEKYETSPKEIEPQNGHCRFLKSDDTGCTFGEDRPGGCKIFPLEVEKIDLDFLIGMDINARNQKVMSLFGKKM